MLFSPRWWPTRMTRSSSFRAASASLSPTSWRVATSWSRPTSRSAKLMVRMYLGKTQETGFRNSTQNSEFSPTCFLKISSSSSKIPKLLKMLEERKLKMNSGNIRAWMINTEEPLGRRLMEKLKGACDAIRKVGAKVLLERPDQF